MPVAPPVPSYAGTRALVLGASGFIGEWVVRALSAAGAHVIATRRGTAPDGPRSVSPIASPTSVTADLAAPGTVARLIGDVGPDVVFNLAGYGVDRSERDPAVMDAINTRTVRELAAAMGQLSPAAWTGLQIVHAGSALEYGTTSGRLVEDALAQPTTDYGRTKLAATQALAAAVAATGVRAVTARLFTVYGAGEHAGRLLPSLFEAARTGARVSLSAGRQARDFTYVEDVAEGLLRLGAGPVPQGTVVNLATGRLTSVRVFAETAGGVLGIPPDRLGFGDHPTRDDEMWHGEVDVNRLEKTTGWRPDTPIALGIARAWRWHHAR